MSRWPLRKALYWQTAPAFRPLLGLCAGILCYECGLRTPVTLDWIFGILIVAVAGLLIVGFNRRRGQIEDWLFLLLFWLVFALTGWLAYAVNDPRHKSLWFGHRIDSTAVYVVRLKESPQPRTASFRAEVTVLGLFDRRHIKHSEGKALLYLSKDFLELPEAGDTVLVRGNWSQVRNSTNPFSFDNRRFRARQGIFLQQFLRPGDLQILGRRKPSDRSFPEQVHRWCGQQLNHYIRDSATLGLLQAMILGDEQALDPDWRQTYSETGVVHIVSISGAHVAVLFLVVTTMLKWIKGIKGRWIRYGLGLFLVWWYVLMAGAPPSALRSAVMFSVIALSVVSGRQGQALNTLTATALILLIGNPAWLFAVGFQLSFLAVLSMMLFYQPLVGLWPTQSWLGRKLLQAFAASLAAEVLTAPLVVYYFHNFPLFFLIANLFAGILVGMLALIGGMAVIATSALPSIAGAIAWLLQHLVQIFNSAMRYLQHWTPECLRHLQMDFSEMLLIYLIISAIGYGWIVKERRAIWFAFPAFVLLIISLDLDAWNAHKQERLIVYENGSKPLIERIRGSSFQRISGDTTMNPFARAAHTGWHAWHRSATQKSPLFRLGDRLVFVLNENEFNRLNSGFPVDVLIWAGTGRLPEPESLLSLFHPKTMVFASGLKPSKRTEWSAICARQGTRLHEVGKDGAYLLQTCRPSWIWQ